MLDQKLKNVIENCNKIEIDLLAHWDNQHKEEKDEFRVLNITWEPNTFAVIKNRLKLSDFRINELISKLLKNGLLERVKHRHAQNRSEITSYVNTIGKIQAGAVRRLWEFDRCEVGHMDVFDFRHHWIGRAVSFEVQSALTNALGMNPDKEFKIDYTAEKLIIIARIK